MGRGTGAGRSDDDPACNAGVAPFGQEDPKTGCFLISRVRERSAALDARIDVGDVIVEVDGRQVLRILCRHVCSCSFFSAAASRCRVEDTGRVSREAEERECLIKDG